MVPTIELPRPYHPTPHRSRSDNFDGPDHNIHYSSNIGEINGKHATHIAYTHNRDTPPISGLPTAIEEAIHPAKQ